MLGLPAEHDLSGRATGGARQFHHAPVAQRRAISSWKAFAPAHAGKLAIEASIAPCAARNRPARFMREKTASSPGCWMDPTRDTTFRLPGPGEPKRAILESFTKEHSAEYQAQALIDLAFRMRKQIPDLALIDKIVIHTSHHTHSVIGTRRRRSSKIRSRRQPRNARSLDHVYFRRGAAGWPLASRR